MISTVVDFYCGKKIDENDDKHIRKKFLLTSIIVNLGILGFFKYFDFFLLSFHDLFSIVGLEFSPLTLNIFLPVGISFYTFQTMSYTIDIYNKKMKHTDNFMAFAVYVSFFPQLVAGPIERARNLIPQFLRSRNVNYDDVWQGLILVTMGYFKKVLISDQIAHIADNAFANWESLSSFQLLEGLVIYSLQIYFDFSGYSDIARGVAKWFGIDLMVNFKQPYLSLNITEFWRRWHISLSSWLRDYLYIPLGGNRLGIKRAYINISITMLLGGLWHGANWTFIVWGALHGVYLSVHKFFLQKKKLKINITNDVKTIGYLLKNIHKIILTYSLVLVTWLMFRSQDISTAYYYLLRMLKFEGEFDSDIAVFLLCMFSLLFIIDYPIYRKGNEFILNKLPNAIKYTMISTILIIILIFIFQQNVELPFIYFQF